MRDETPPVVLAPLILVVAGDVHSYLGGDVGDDVLNGPREDARGGEASGRDDRRNRDRTGAGRLGTQSLPPGDRGLGHVSGSRLPKDRGGSSRLVNRRQLASAHLSGHVLRIRPPRLVDEGIAVGAGPPQGGGNVVLAWIWLRSHVLVSAVVAQRDTPPAAIDRRIDSIARR
jgi:hypothetical protein